MADVYSADDLQLGGVVAVKILRPDLASAEMRLRMVQEARAAVAIGHPNIVRVFAVDAVETTVYLVMELLRGATLEQHLVEQPDGRLPWRAAFELLLPAMDALHAAHQRGFVHRDVKPTNLFVPAAGGRCEGAIVLDLGIARRDPELRTEHSPPLTEVGRVLGTPAYMSPEQADGGALDARSDVYSMAVTLYRAIVGRPPFVAKSGREQLLVMHLFEAAPTMRRMAPTARIPRAAAEAIHRALAKDPGDRPQSMREFASELRRVVGASRGSGRAVNRLAAAGVFGVLFGGVGGAWLSARASPPGASPALAEPIAPATLVEAAPARPSILEPAAPVLRAAPEDVPAAARSAPSRRRKAVDEVRGFLARQDPRMTRCAGGVGSEPLAVSVRVEFSHADQPPTILAEPHEAMFAAACVARELRALEFPRAPAGTRVRHVFTLVPAGGAT